MRNLTLACLVVLVLVTLTQGSPKPQLGFIKGAVKGAREMHRAYTDMREANFKNSDKYFHARGNRDAAKHGAGGKWAAKTISDVREFTDRLRGGSAAQSRADQAANKLGRRGGNINVYRPRGLPKKY